MLLGWEGQERSQLSHNVRSAAIAKDTHAKIIPPLLRRCHARHYQSLWFTVTVITAPSRQSGESPAHQKGRAASCRKYGDISRGPRSVMRGPTRLATRKAESGI